MNQLTPVQRYTLWSASQRRRWAGRAAEEEGPSLVFPHLAGRYYTAPEAGSAAAQNLSATLNRLYFMPFLVPVAGSYDRLAIIRKTATSTVNYRLGVYGPIVDAVAGAALVGESPEIETTGDEVGAAVVDIALDAGWYVLAMVCDVSGKNVAGVSDPEGIQTIGETDLSAYTAGAGGVGVLVTGGYGSHTYGALPAVFPAVSSYSAAPKIFARKA